MLSWSLPNSTFYPSQRSNVDQKGHLAEKGVILHVGYYRKREVITSYNYNFRWFFTRKTLWSATSRASRRILALKGDKFLLLIEKNARQYKIPTNFSGSPVPKFGDRDRKTQLTQRNVFEDVLSKLSTERYRRPSFHKIFQIFSKIFQVLFSQSFKSQTLTLILFEIRVKWFISCLSSTTTSSVPQATPRASIEGPHLK